MASNKNLSTGTCPESPVYELLLPHIQHAIGERRVPALPITVILDSYIACKRNYAGVDGDSNPVELERLKDGSKALRNGCVVGHVLI